MFEHEDRDLILGNVLGCTVAHLSLVMLFRGDRSQSRLLSQAFVLSCALPSRLCFG